MRIRPWLAWAVALGLLAAATPSLAQEDDASEAPRPKRRKKKKKSAPAEEQPAKPAAPPPSSGDDDLDLQSTKGGSLDSLPDPSATPRKAKPPLEEAPEPSKRRAHDEDATGSEPRKAPADDDSGSEPRKRRAAGDSDSTVEVHKRSTDDEPAPRRKRSSDDEAPAEAGEGRSKRKSDEELGDDERKARHASEEGEGERDKSEGYTADWSVVSGTNVGTDQRAVWAELGIPGLSALYLQGRGRNLDMGGGLELDFPPLNGSVGQTPRGLSALRLIGSIHYTPLRSPPLLLYLHFDPQWILAFNGIGMIYLPVTFGAGLDLQVVHLALDLGLAPFSASTRVYFPFRTFGVAPPYVGVAGEYPITDQLVATLRIRLQTFPWTAQGLFNNGPVSVFFFGNVSAGVAYRF